MRQMLQSVSASGKMLLYVAASDRMLQATWIQSGSGFVANGSLVPPHPPPIVSPNTGSSMQLGPGRTKG